jgi:hypothetical protein
MNFYLISAAIGVALGITWVAWLFAARAFLRASYAKPGAIFSVLQVAVVLTLMLAAYKVSDYCFGILNITEPKDIVLFRRVWLLIWAVSMVASIQIFLDIRRLSMPVSGQRPPARPVTGSSQRPAPRPPTRPRRH